MPSPPPSAAHGTISLRSGLGETLVVDAHGHRLGVIRQQDRSVGGYVVCGFLLTDQSGTEIAWTAYWSLMEGRAQDHFGGRAPYFGRQPRPSGHVDLK